MLKDHRLNEFLEILASDCPAPGGGSVAAYCGGLGSALVSMVTALSLGREKYKEFEAQNIEINNKAILLKNELVVLVDEDTNAYTLVGDAMSLPKSTPEEKKARSAAMQKAMKTASLTPFKTMEKAVEVIELASAAFGKSNASAASDLGVSALCSLTCLRGAWLNVKINLTSIKDEEFVNDLRAKAVELLKKGEEIAEKLYQDVESGIDI